MQQIQSGYLRLIIYYTGIGTVQGKKKRRKNNFFLPHYFYNVAVKPRPNDRNIST